MIVANRRMKDVGRLREFHINTKEKSCSGVLLLAGEAKPVDVSVGKYELVNDGHHKVTLHLRDVSCSREWMDKLAGRLEPQMNIKLPCWLASVLRLVRIV